MALEPGCLDRLTFWLRRLPQRESVTFLGLGFPPGWQESGRYRIQTTRGLSGGTCSPPSNQSRPSRQEFPPPQSCEELQDLHRCPQTAILRREKSRNTKRVPSGCRDPFPEPPPQEHEGAEPGVTGSKAAWPWPPLYPSLLSAGALAYRTRASSREKMNDL